MCLDGWQTGGILANPKGRRPPPVPRSRPFGGLRPRRAGGSRQGPGVPAAGRGTLKPGGGGHAVCGAAVVPPPADGPCRCGSVPPLALPRLCPASRRPVASGVGAGGGAGRATDAFHHAHAAGVAAAVAPGTGGRASGAATGGRRPGPVPEPGIFPAGGRDSGAVRCLRVHGPGRVDHRPADAGAPPPPAPAGTEQPADPPGLAQPALGLSHPGLASRGHPAPALGRPCRSLRGGLPGGLLEEGAAAAPGGVARPPGALQPRLLSRAGGRAAGGDPRGRIAGRRGWLGIRGAGQPVLAALVAVCQAASQAAACRRGGRRQRGQQVPEGEGVYPREF